MITVESVFDAKTYKAFYRYDAYVKNSQAKMLWALVLVGLALGVFGLVTARMQYFWIGLIVLVLMPLIYVWSTESKMRRNIRIARLDREPYEVRFDINEKKIVTLNKKTAKHATYKWADVQKIGKVKDYVFLYINRTQAVVVSRAQLAEGDIEKMQTWAQAAAGEREAQNAARRAAEKEARARQKK